MSDTGIFKPDVPAPITPTAEPLVAPSPRSDCTTHGIDAEKINKSTPSVSKIPRRRPEEHPVQLSNTNLVSSLNKLANAHTHTPLAHRRVWHIIKFYSCLLFINFH